MSLLLALNTNAQLSVGGRPYSWGHKIDLKIPVITMPSIDVNLFEKDKSEENGPKRFGVKHITSINPKTDGEWSTLENGDKLWVLGIECPEAKSVYLQYSNFNLAPGSYLYVYNKSKTELLGGFSARNNSSVFATDLIIDDNVVLELYEPYGVFVSSFIINGVIHGYKFINEAGTGYGNSGNCQVNINCTPEGDDWQDEKRGVAKMLLDGFLCSGSLINNSCNDGKPYFLTANHCVNYPSYGLNYDAISNPSIPIVLHWDYESVECENSGNPKYFSTSSAKVIANKDYSDFALLELENLPEGYDVYFNGWSTTNSPMPNGVGIHHPAGDVKKIATHNQTLQYGLFWKVFWSQTTNGFSVTEGGSSGSPLFMNDGKIIGQLYGGSPLNCSDPANDLGLYGNFGVSWDYDQTPQRQLKNWLKKCSNVEEINGGYYKTCVPEIYVNYPIWNVSSFISSDFIQGTGIIHAGANVLFEAQNSIELLTGFEVQGEFEALIKACENHVVNNKKGDDIINVKSKELHRKDYGVSIFPNPVVNSFTLNYSTGNASGIVVNVYNFSGQLIVSKKVSSKSGLNSQVISVANYSSGVYFLEVIIDGFPNEKIRFIKE
tara:strand:- start:182117 stop:183931 length:1815 start_codon:yes stop_codon:yes gene_type:complete